MAPPVPVYTSTDIKRQYAPQLTQPDKYQCQLKSITQHECTFRPHPQGIHPPEIICLPFKRLFQRCLIDHISQENGKKVKLKRWINIEVTDAETNRDLFVPGSKYSEAVRDFKNAEVEFRKLMENESEGMV